MSATFRVTAQDPGSAARTGRLETPHGAVETPAFMPVASQGTVKGLTHAQVEGLMNGGDAVAIVLAAPGERPSTATNRPSPKAQNGDVEVRVSQSALDHG